MAEREARNRSGPAGRGRSAERTSFAQRIDERTIVHARNDDRVEHAFARRVTQTVPEITESGHTTDYLLGTIVGGSADIRRFSGRRLTGSSPGAGTIMISGTENEDAWLMPEPVTMIHVHVAASTFRSVLSSEAEIDPSTVTIEPVWGREDPVLGSLMSAALHACSSPGGADALLLDSLETTIATRVLRAYSNASARLERAPGPATREDARVVRAKDFIEAHLGESLRIARIAEAACLSPSRLQHHFRTSTGLPVHAWVLARRCERARELIAAGRLPLCQVAERCGFASQSHLTSVFRERYGVTPGAVRRG